MNGDGRGDLVLATFQADLPGRDNAGLAYVVYGTGATGTQDLTNLGAGGGYVVNGADGERLPRARRRAPVTSTATPGRTSCSPRRRPGMGGTAYALFGFGPAALTYEATARSGAVGTPLEPLTPNLVRRTGPPAFSVQPALPAGLTLDPATGAIAGTPTAPIPATPFTVTMTDLAGSATAVLTLDVKAAATRPRHCSEVAHAAQPEGELRQAQNGPAVPHPALVPALREGHGHRRRSSASVPAGRSGR